MIWKNSINKIVLQAKIFRFFSGFSIIKCTYWHRLRLIKIMFINYKIYIFLIVRSYTSAITDFFSRITRNLKFEISFRAARVPQVGNQFHTVDSACCKFHNKPSLNQYKIDNFRIPTPDPLTTSRPQTSLPRTIMHPYTAISLNTQSAKL